jgi:hypothetical protein
VEFYFIFEFTRNRYKLSYGSQFNLKQDNLKHVDMFKTEHISKHNLMKVDQCFKTYRIFMKGRLNKDNKDNTINTY